MATTHTNRLQSGAIQPIKSVEQVAIGTAIKPIEPNDLNEVMTFAQVAVRSGAFGLKNIEEAAFRILYGRELGLSVFQAIMGIDNIQGRPGLKAATVASLIQRSPEFRYKVIEWTPEKCVIHFFDSGSLAGASSFTIDDAKRAQVYKQGSNWDKYPKAMLFARAITQGARAYCPSIFFGPVYSSEELADGVIDAEIIEPEPPTEVKPETVAEQPAKPAKAAKKAKPEPTPEPQPAAEHEAPFDDAPQTETVAEKTQKLDEWAARAAKRFDEKGQASFAMPGAVIEEMYHKFLDLGFVEPGAKDYRERTQAIASIESPWKEILEHLKTYVADLAAELDAPPQAEPDEPGSDG